MRRLSFLCFLLTGLLYSCSSSEQPTSLFGEWRATAIHLPEPYMSVEGKDRIDIDDYGSARLLFKEDSTYESSVNLVRDLQIKQPVGPTDVTTTLWSGKFTFQRFGKFRDSVGYLVLTNQDFISSSRHALRHGVLITTTTVKGHTFEIIWEKEN